MDITPSTVATGDSIRLLVTRTADGGVEPVEHECSLILKGETADLAALLEDHDVVAAELTVTKCMWAQSGGSDMLSVTVDACHEAEHLDGDTDTNSEPDNTASQEQTPTHTDDADASTERSDADTDRGEAADINETTRENDDSDDSPASTNRVEREAAAVVEWDRDEPLDRDVLQRVLNRGQRVEEPSLENELDYGERNAIEIADLLIDLASELEVSSPVCYRAAELYADAMNHDLIRGKAKVVTAAAAFRVATLQEEEHRPLAAIEETLAGSLEEDAQAGEIADRERRLISELDIDPSIVLIQPQKYLPYLARKLAVEEDAAIVQKAESFAMRASSQGGGSSPWSIAAAAVYCAGLQNGTKKFTQQQVAYAANLSEVTIRDNYKTLLDD